MQNLPKCVIRNQGKETWIEGQGETSILEKTSVEEEKLLLLLPSPTTNTNLFITN